VTPCPPADAPTPTTSGPEPDRTAEELEGFRSLVLAGAPNLVRWPWRATRDPWAVLVSEVMLQQTQAARVVEPFGRFLDRFPTPRAAATASPAEVVRAWAGLGYNRRALALRRTAEHLVAEHGGQVPDSLVALERLAGVGPYTARAVLCFAFGQAVGVVDTNVRRVLQRAWLGRALPPARLQAVADRLAPPEHSWEFHQVLMDLGARTCTGRRPACASCPLAGCCRWRAAGCPEPDPGGPRARQSPFAGSNRQGRGRLVAALRSGPIPAGSWAVACGWPGDQDRAAAVVGQLLAEGLAEIGPDGELRLPGDGPGGWAADG
jgi:A/G-specific adenine glycosylase